MKRSSNVAVIFLLCLIMISSIPLLVSTNQLSNFTSSSSVLITEVLYDSPNSDDTNEEWIELYNPTSSTIDMTGWTINDNIGSFSISVALDPGDYLILAKNSTAFQNLYGFLPNVSTLSLSLGNSGDFLSLKNNNDLEVDFVAWENGIAGWTVGATDHPIARNQDADQFPIDTDSTTDWSAVSDLGNPASGYIFLVPEEPIVKFVSPTPGNNSKVQGEITISVQVTDPDGISVFELYINDTLVTNSFEYIWNTTQSSTGIYLISAKANDTLDNWAKTILILEIIETSNGGITVDDAIKVMAYNIEAGGSDPSWIDVVEEENADIIIFVETGNWDDNNNQKLDQVIFDLNSFFTNENPYEGYTDQGASTFSGIAILSRFDIVNINELEYVTLDNDTILNPSHDFIDAEINLGSQSIHVIGAHLKCCSGLDNEAKRESAQEGIINYMDNLGNVPIIYGGDFNSFSPLDANNMGDLNDGPVDMLINPVNPHKSTVHTWTDVHKTLNPTDDGHTYNSVQYSSRIDFLFVNQFFSDKLVNSTTGDTTSAETGSDHFSVDVFIDLSKITDSTTSQSTAVVESTSTSLTSSSVFSSSSIDSETLTDSSSETNASPGFDIYFVGVILFGFILIRKRRVY